MPRPTQAQIACLRLAARDTTGIRYYRGGWYSIPALLGDDQQHAAHGGGAESTTPNTLTACESRGWLVENGAAGIYNKRWTLTDEGRKILAEVHNDA